MAVGACPKAGTDLDTRVQDDPGDPALSENTESRLGRADGHPLSELDKIAAHTVLLAVIRIRAIRLVRAFADVSENGLCRTTRIDRSTPLS